MDANASNAIEILIGNCRTARASVATANQSWLNLLECSRAAIIGIDAEVEELRRAAREERERLQAEIKQLKLERADHLRKKIKEIKT